MISKIEKCPMCGSNMVEKPPTVIYTSHPPQYDKILWCGCGYEEFCGRVTGMTEREALQKEWEIANQVLKG